MNTQFNNIPPVVKNLIIINIIMLLATWVLGSTFGIDLTQNLGLHYFKSELFQPYQIVTHMFMHGGLWHLFFNMFALWMFGRVLESVWGSKRFFIYFMVTGLGAAALHTFVIHLQMSGIINDIQAFNNTPSPDALAILVKDHFPEYYSQVYSKLLEGWYANPDSPGYIARAEQFLNELLNFRMNIPTVGASGAVFGVLLAFGMLFPNTQLMLLFPPIPIRAKYFVILYGGLELWLGLTQPGSNVAHFAHLGGMLFGFFLIKYWKKSRSNFY
ncbi:MAG: rhomboid family intramembrane serine protease [Bacteroidales bacterium]|jgi:membrane associated rhomboid family serine protease|nr:rhomboid family intramembrane serine protease [Bacteroidales bacterium]